MIRRLSVLSAGLALGLAAALCGPATGVSGAEPDALFDASAANEGLARPSSSASASRVIIPLPEEAAEIYVGDPKIATAIVRSARLIYVAGLANGQTTIFALAPHGRKIETIEVSVGRDVGDLKRSP